MSAHAGVLRSRDSLLTALRDISSLERTLATPLELRNMALAAKFVTVAALAREESRGAHFRGDHPEAKPRLAKRSLLTLDEIEQFAREAVASTSGHVDAALGS